MTQLAAIGPKLRHEFKIVYYLYKTDVPFGAYAAYVRTRLRKLIHYREFTRARSAAAARLNQLGSFTTDWFSAHTFEWNRVFARKQWRDRPVAALEIGSWEGRSSAYLLDTLPQASLLAVDTWEGSDEHADTGMATGIEARFDANTRAFASRLKKYKGRSFSFFATQTLPSASFDFIYIDASHYADDVLCDALKAFPLLKPGGVMIFDDYLWQWYPEPRHNPAAAVNAFLRLKRGEYRLLAAGDQMIVEKR
ncbi:MAG: class I SAM-dependent methyltransferase [Pseudomonadota bacterium]|nr:class I SAM-dependent methyltransferase [Pseudomonadota bacterium]